MPISSDSAGALSGVRVIDATQMLAGPLCGMRLGDLGADVIKVERPGTGEFNRTHGFEDVTVRGEMTTFLAVNRNKRGAAIDLKHPEGRQALLDLAQNSDVLIQNFRRGTAERLGLGYEDLAAVNPQLIYCSISGYGATGPYRDRPGQDLVIQGYSGSMFSVGSKSDPPLPGALWAADVMTGYQAAIGILAALQARHQTGRGQHVEVDMLSVVLDAQVQELVTFLNSGKSPARTDEPTAHASIPAPYGVYRTADGWLTIAMSPLPALGDALDDDVLRGMKDYNDGHTRKDEAYARLRDAFVSQTTDEWIEQLDRHGVWCGPVYDYDDLLSDPHVQAVGMIAEQPHSAGGTIRTTRVPVALSETPTAIRRGAPSLGADTAQILTEVAGYDHDRVALLARQGAIGTGKAPQP